MRSEHFSDFFLSFGAPGRKRPLSQPNFVNTSSRESHIVVADCIVQAQQLIEPFQLEIGQLPSAHLLELTPVGCGRVIHLHMIRVSTRR